MANIQKTLDSLQPYVIGIRYVEGTALVDAVFKEGWTIPEDKNIKRIKGNEEMNYVMIFSEVKGVGLDDLLGYVEKTIKLNQEREKKHELLKSKVNELKEIFKKYNLNKLSTLKFSFAEEDLVPNLNDFDVDIDEDEMPPLEPSQQIEEVIEEEIIEETHVNSAPYLDEKGNPIELTEEEKEMLEEEARAERNRKLIANKKNNPIVNAMKNVELPPKKKMVLNERDYDTDCDCGPNEACEKCIDSKDF